MNKFSTASLILLTTNFAAGFFATARAEDHFTIHHPTCRLKVTDDSAYLDQNLLTQKGYLPYTGKTEADTLILRMVASETEWKVYTRMAEYVGSVSKAILGVVYRASTAIDTAKYELEVSVPKSFPIVRDRPNRFTRQSEVVFHSPEYEPEHEINSNGDIGWATVVQNHSKFTSKLAVKLSDIDVGVLEAETAAVATALAELEPCQPDQTVTHATRLKD